MGHAERIERHGDVERLHLSRTLAGRALKWTSVYLVGDALVDTGCSSARPAFARFLASRRIASVLTTHEHEDHVGNHALLPPGTLVHAPALAKRFLDEGTPPFPYYRRFVWGDPDAAPGARLALDKVGAAGRVFRVVPTPGHSMDHHAYFDEEHGALYSGDAYMGKFRAARLAEDVGTGVASLRRMADLDPAVLYPAHGPILERPRAKLLETAEHFEGLARRARLLDEKGLSRRRIAREVIGREPGLTYVSGGEFSTLHLVENLLRPTMAV